MTPVRFTTAVLPPEQRLPLFRSGAASYDIDAIGDPLAFAASWRVLQLGDVNALHSTISPNAYRRTRQRIEADGEDRFGIFHVRRGWVVGTIDGTAVRVGPGDGMVWDLSRPFELSSPSGLESDIFTLPRYMMEEVSPTSALAGRIDGSPLLKLAVDHFYHLLDHAADIPEESATFHGRALRDMLAMAICPTHLVQSARDTPDAPVLQRICRLIDQTPGASFDPAGLASSLSLTEERVAETLERFGGMDELIERRRLLIAYRLLSDPEETASVSVIALRCGFTDIQRFSRRFRRAFHTSASDLRTHHRAYLPTWAGAYHLETRYGALLSE